MNDANRGKYIGKHPRIMSKQVFKNISFLLDPEGQTNGFLKILLLSMGAGSSPIEWV